MSILGDFNFVLEQADRTDFTLAWPLVRLVHWGGIDVRRLIVSMRFISNRTLASHSKWWKVVLPLGWIESTAMRRWKHLRCGMSDLVLIACCLMQATTYGLRPTTCRMLHNAC